MRPGRKRNLAPNQSSKNQKPVANDTQDKIKEEQEQLEAKEREDASEPKMGID